MTGKRILALVFTGGLALVLGSPGPVQGDEREEAKQAAEMANRLGREKKYAEALEPARKAVKLAPNNEAILMLVSEIEYRTGHFADGLDHAQQALKINDRSGVGYLLAAANAYGNEEPELALEYCRKVLKMGPAAVGKGLYHDAELYEGLLVPKTYTITWKLEPSNLDGPTRSTLNGNIDVALPKDNLPYQKVAVQVKGAANTRVVKGEVNDVLHVIRQGDKPFQVITTVTVTPTSYKKKLEKAGQGTLPPEARAYLGPAEALDPASPKLQKVALELKSKTSSVETVRAIIAWMKKNIEYKLQEKKITKLDFKNVEEILERRHAECRGYTTLFTALCRAAGVPARPVWGILFQPRDQGGFVSHNWNEVYITGCGWVPVDPQKPESFGWLPTTHVRVFMDLRKSPTSRASDPLHYLLYLNGDKLQYEEMLQKN
jgi:tetratricopeptide (TPR) repeat protein